MTNLKTIIEIKKELKKTYNKALWYIYLSFDRNCYKLVKELKQIIKKKKLQWEFAKKVDIELGLKLLLKRL